MNDAELSRPKRNSRLARIKNPVLIDVVLVEYKGIILYFHYSARNMHGFSPLGDADALRLRHEFPYVQPQQRHRHGSWLNVSQQVRVG